VAIDVGAGAVVIWAETGRLARLVSKHRLDRPVVALAASEQVQRRVRLYYGIEPVRVERADSADALIHLANRVAVGAGRAGSGDRIVIGFGPHSLAGGETGSIIIHTVEDQ
jgi:pyruvate kinase